MKKTIKDGSLYFRQKELIRPLSAGLLIASILVAWFTYSWIAYIIAGIVAPVSLVMFFVAGSRYISENDMAEQLEHAMLDYDKSITDMANYDRVVLRQPAPVACAAYDFGESAKYFKKGKNGTPVSDQYIGVHFFFTKDALMIIGRRVSIAELNVDTGEGIRPFADTVPFAALRSAVIEEHSTPVLLTASGKTMPVKWYELVLTPAEAEGRTIRLPVPNNMDVIGLCDDINRRAL